MAKRTLKKQTPKAKATKRTPITARKSAPVENTQTRYKPTPTSAKKASTPKQKSAIKTTPAHKGTLVKEESPLSLIKSESPQVPTNLQNVFPKSTNFNRKESDDLKKPNNKKGKSATKAPVGKAINDRASRASKASNASKATNNSKAQAPKKDPSSKELRKRNSVNQQLSGKADVKEVSEELGKLIQKVELKKTKKGSSSDKKDNKSKTPEKKFQAKMFGYNLQKNSKMTAHTPFINLFELATKGEYTNSDVVLAIIEIAQNHEYYSIPYSSKGNHFWEEIVQFNELRRLFQFYRPETIKKYWRLLNYKDKAEAAAVMVKANKVLLEDKKPKLLTIVTGLQNVLNKKIQNFSDFILNHHKYISIGLPSEKETKMLSNKRTSIKVFKGDNLTDEVKNYLNRGAVPASLQLLEEKDEIKSIFFV
jgi:hypothetical protein